MEELVSEIESYAAARGLSPGTVVQYATDQGGRMFASWKEGRSTCTLATADRVRAYMRDNPPPKAPVEDPEDDEAAA